MNTQPSEWHTVRIHPTSDNQEPHNISYDFKTYVAVNDIQDYILTFEEDAARPHYHALFQSKRSQFKLRQAFKIQFPYLKGNKSFAFSKIYDHENYKKYVCKMGCFIAHSDNYTIDDLLQYKSNYLIDKGNQTLEKKNKQQMVKKKALDTEDKFKEYIKNSKTILHKSDFPQFLKNFIIQEKISSWTKTFLEKYYRLFLRHTDESLYEEYLFNSITDFIACHI